MEINWKQLEQKQYWIMYWKQLEQKEDRNI